MGVQGLSPDTVLTADEDRLPGLPLRQVFAEGRTAGTLLLWVPFSMGFGILTVAVLWTPALLRSNGISPAATAFVVAFNGLGACVGRPAAGRLVERFGQMIGPLIAGALVGAVFVLLFRRWLSGRPGAVPTPLETGLA